MVKRGSHTRYRNKIQALINESLLLLGGFFITSLSGGLNPKAVAGGPSVTRFTHKSWTGISPSGMPIAAVRKMQATSPIFEEIMYLHNDKERRKETKKKRLDQAYVFGYPDPLIGFFKGLGPIRNYKQNNKIFNRYSVNIIYLIYMCTQYSQVLTH